MRPTPTIHLSREIGPNTHEQVISTAGTFAILYQGARIALRRGDAELPGRNYLATTHNTCAHALSQAKRLNEIFNTTEFTVSEMIIGPAMTQ